MTVLKSPEKSFVEVSVAAEILGDVFVVSLDSGGRELWTKSFVSPQNSFEGARSLILFDNNDLMVAGHKEDELNPSFERH